ncbi:hypothetical protein QR680_010645 [Steinernema hermaphroditum]|uniref:Major facilitator superfamily (MFS) profile domain-containing protein n=1 Tax=Steinernema hermaphroditum TaxID=289476 RepID=A0AA39MBX1_9BILA|nr:hypothetical protein QR680_010645 [Steinernema hermaphroditum]
MPSVVPKTDWRSLYVSSFLPFCASVEFSILFTNLWPYLKTIDEEATEEFLSYIVAGCSVAQCLASPLLGYVSNKIRQVRLPVARGLSSMFLGNLIYLSSEVLPYNRRYSVLLARFLTGVGSANLALLHTYASTCSHPNDLARANSLITGGLVTGAVAGPLLQLLFNRLSHPGVRLFSNWRLNIYTASSYAGCVMNVLCLLCLYRIFEEHRVGIEKNDESNNVKVKVPQYNRIAVLICNLSKFVQQFIYTSIEVVLSPLAMTVFAFTKEETVEKGALAHGFMAGLNVLVFFVFFGFKLDKVVRYRIGTIAGLSLYTGFLFITYPWAFLPGNITTYHTNNATENLTGCNVDKLQWCSTTPAISPWVFYIAFIVCVGLGYPTIDICLNTVHARVLGPRRQGTMQGILFLTAGIGRILASLSIGWLYASHGPATIWLLQMIMGAVVLSLWTVFYNHMRQLSVPSSLNATELSETESERSK